jgi:hypothetical protein
MPDTVADYRPLEHATAVYLQVDSGIVAHFRKAFEDADVYNDVIICVDGCKRMFTLSEFKNFLGFGTEDIFV